MVDVEKKKRRLIEVDRVTGFAIFLVVVGHLVARQPPAGNEWYVSLKFYIYEFHMPLFMFMSGLIFQYTSTPITSLSEYGQWAIKKIGRLAPGFLLVGFSVTLGKDLFGSVIHVDNSQNSLVDGLVRLFLFPTESDAASLWYIYVLLEFYVLFPLALLASRQRHAVLFVVVVAMHCVHLFVRLPPLFALHDAFEFALYFWLGAMTCAHFDRLMALLERRGPLFGLAFLASFGSTSFLWWTHSQTIVGLASIPAMLWLIGTNQGRIGSICAFLGRYTFVIYLLNTIAIGLTKGIMLKILPWDGPAFYLYFVVLLTAGLGAPILAQQWVFSRHPTVARIMN